MDRRTPATAASAAPAGAPASTISQITTASLAIASRIAITGVSRTSGSTIDHTAQLGRVFIEEGLVGQLSVGRLVNTRDR
jgi:hypothetical protein